MSAAKKTQKTPAKEKASTKPATTKKAKEAKGLNAVYARYDRVTREALAMADAAPRLDPVRAAEILDMARRYVSDSTYLHERGDTPRALAALAYAHGWLDAGARMKLYHVTDSRLFTVDEE